MSSVEFIGIHKINRKKAQVKATQEKKNRKMETTTTTARKNKQHGLIKYED